MTDAEPMTDAELRVVRDYLGLSGDWLAGHLGVTGRQLRKWEAGTAPIPDGVRLEIERLEQIAAATVTATIAQLNDVADAEIRTYRTTEHYRSAHPESIYPASYHRAIIARVAQEVPGPAISFWQP